MPFRASVVSILICLSTACTTLSQVAPQEIKPGDTVRILTADGATHCLQVTTVGPPSLTGNAVRMSKGCADVAGTRVDLLYQDMRQVDVQRTNGGKTTALVVAVVVVAAVAIATGGGSHTPGYTR